MAAVEQYGYPYTPEPPQSRGGSAVSRPTKSALRRRHRLHEQAVMRHLNEIRLVRKSHGAESRDHARKMARKIAMDELAMEWLKHDKGTVEARAYLVDKMLPTLVLGVEKLLTEVEKRKLAETVETNPNFNPINFLAQFLMRNNPKYSNFAEASPYVRGLRQVMEDIKDELYAVTDNKLAKIKSEARQKRVAREVAEESRRVERGRRKDKLVQHFSDWEGDEGGRVDLAMLQNALRSFQEQAETFPPEIQALAKLALELGDTDETGKTLSMKEFSAYVGQYVQDMPPEIFDVFLEHMNGCAKVYRGNTDKEVRKVALTHLFMACDHSKSNLLDRHRVLSLFESFFDNAIEHLKVSVRNPRKWPVVEVYEVAEGYESEDEEGAEDQTKYFDENKDVTDETKAAVDQVAKALGSEGEGEGEATDKPETETEKEEEEGETPLVTDTSPGEETTGTSGEGEDQKPSDDGIEKVTSDDQRPSEEEEGEGQEKHETETQEKEEGATPLAQPEGEVTETERSEEDSAKSETEAVSDSSDQTPAKEGKKVVIDSAKDDASDDQRPPKTQQSMKSAVSFAEGTILFSRENTRDGLFSSRTRSQSQASAFDETTLNVSQFVQLVETFLGDAPLKEAFELLVKYLKEGYVETEEEKMDRLVKAQRVLRSAKRKAALDSIFEKWDNDGSGYLDLDEVETVLLKYKDGQEAEPITRAKLQLKEAENISDMRLSKREFREFIQLIAGQIIVADAVDYIVEYLQNCIERSYAERVRGEARKKWLQQIIGAAESSGARMEPVYKAVFTALYKDAETHGNEKRISANVALLEHDADGRMLLEYVAATPEDVPYVVGKRTSSEDKGISLQVVETGKPIHVPRVRNHGNIHFFNSDRVDEGREGSLIVVPLKDHRKRVFGTMGIDTMNDPHNKSIFITHEIQYFQGVAKSFSIAYHHVDIRMKMLRIAESALSWIHRRAPKVKDTTFYMVEPNGKPSTSDYVLRKMLVTNEKGGATILKLPLKMERKDNLFRDYLFNCADNSENVAADAYGERHMAVPLRDDTGMAIAIVDISTGDIRTLPAHERKEVQKMLKLLQLAFTEITKEFRSVQKRTILEGEEEEEVKVDTLFDRLMLMDLQQNVAKLDGRAYAELKSYKEPPQLVHNIIKGVLGIFFPDRAVAGDFEDWIKCKPLINTELNRKIQAFDPTDSASGAEQLPTDVIGAALENVPHGEVAKHGSMPSLHLYNWAFVCLSMIEHAKKMAEERRSKVHNVDAQE